VKYAMFLPGSDGPAMAGWARRIEDAGFDSLWQGELVNSSIIPLAAVSHAVSRIKLASGIALAFTRSPVMLAFCALDMDLLTGGRFILGLGVGSTARNNQWYAGRDAGRPVSQMREYIEVARLAMQAAQEGGPFSFDGEFYTVDARNMLRRPSAQPRPLVPIYVAAVRSRMAFLVGEMADGLVGSPLFSPRYLREFILPAVGEGLKKSARTRDQVEVLGQCVTIIEDDLAIAYRVARGMMLFQIWARIYDSLFEFHGFGDVVARVRAIQKGEAKGDPSDEISEEMVDAFCAVGPLERVRETVAEREGLLDTVILTVPFTGTTPQQQDQYRNRILKAFSQ
jgi:probable F420-dependent oxidoreductase